MNARTPDKLDLAELFHENTKLTPYEAGVETLPPMIEHGIVISRFDLPDAQLTNSRGLEETIVRRRTARSFDPQATLTVAALSRLLSLSCGRTGTGEVAGDYGAEFYRASPSAGAVYPVEVYPLILNVGGLPRGAYRYESNWHSLELLRDGDFRASLSDWVPQQPYLRDAGVVFALVGFAGRVGERFGERGYRYMLLEAGHIAQNICLLSCAAGFGVLPVGAFVDSAFDRLLGLDGVTQISLYFVAVGAAARQQT